MKYKVNFKALSTKAKIEYIWGYYRWHILLIICVISIIVSTIFHVMTHKDPLLTVIMLNSYSSMTDTTDAGFEEFFKIYNYENFDGALELKKDLYFYGRESTNHEDYQNYEVLLALLLAGDCEVFFGTGDIYLEFVKQGYFMNLSEVLSDKLLAQYGEQIIYSDDLGECKEYPAAIKLKNNQWLIQNNYYEEECYFGILKNSDTPKIAADFAEFLLEYD